MHRHNSSLFRYRWVFAHDGHFLRFQSSLAVYDQLTILSWAFSLQLSYFNESGWTTSLISAIGPSGEKNFVVIIGRFAQTLVRYSASRKIGSCSYFQRPHIRVCSLHANISHFPFILALSTRRAIVYVLNLHFELVMFDNVMSNDTLSSLDII